VVSDIAENRVRDPVILFSELMKPKLIRLRPRLKNIRAMAKRETIS